MDSGIVHNPVSNLRLGCKIADITKYKKENKSHPNLIIERKLLLTFVLYPPSIFHMPKCTYIFF